MSRYAASLATLALACLPAGALAQERIEVFVIGKQPIHGAVAASAIHRVDALSALIDAMSAGLPADPERAAAIAKARFESLTDADRRQLEAAAHSENLARQYRLSKAPAMVFDGRAVIYGIDDVERARAVYRAWRGG